MNKSYTWSLLCVQVTCHLATNLCYILLRVSMDSQLLSSLNHFFIQHLLYPCCLSYKNKFNLFPLSSLGLICPFIHLLIKSPTYFSHKGNHSSPSLSLGEHVLQDWHYTGHLQGKKILLLCAVLFCIKHVLSFIYHCPLNSSKMERSHIKPG